MIKTQALPSKNSLKRKDRYVGKSLYRHMPTKQNSAICENRSSKCYRKTQELKHSDQMVFSLKKFREETAKLKFPGECSMINKYRKKNLIRYYDVL